MSKVYITSDLHLGHKGVALHRGFKTVEEHNETIISNWNSTVGEKDKVFVLGDITMENSKHYHLLEILNGRIVVIMGNHDKPNHVRKLLEHVDSVAGAVRYKRSILTHIPIHPIEMERFRSNLHGHMHENEIQDKRYKNVCLEQQNYTPQLITKYL